jgi:hypothetical protein
MICPDQESPHRHPLLRFPGSARDLERRREREHVVGARVQLADLASHAPPRVGELLARLGELTGAVLDDEHVLCPAPGVIGLVKRRADFVGMGPRVRRRAHSVVRTGRRFISSSSPGEYGSISSVRQSSSDANACFPPASNWDTTRNSLRPSVR